MLRVGSPRAATRAAQHLQLAKAMNDAADHQTADKRRKAKKKVRRATATKVTNVRGPDGERGVSVPRKSARRRTHAGSLDRLFPFDDELLIVVIETPKGSPNKLAFEPRYGAFMLKGVLPAGAVFPFDFGFVPSTRADDGDPLDVLVLMDAPVFPGCVVPSRVIGVIEAEQTEDGRTERNDRVLAVADNSAAHRSIRDLGDVSQDLIAQIEHFFKSYNEAKGKRFEVKGRSGKRRALALVEGALIGRRR